MQYAEFLDRVQELTDLNSTEQAEQITHVTFATLGERLYRTEIDQLKAQLPKELKDVFYAIQTPEATRQDIDPFNLEEFYNRVSARAEIGFPEAQAQAQAVMTVLREAVTPAVIEEATKMLPEEYDKLFFESTEA